MLNQLTQVSGSDGGSFTYDVLGRRTQRQLAGIGSQPTQWNNPWDRGGPLYGISDLRGSSLATQSVSNGTLALGFAPYGEASAVDASGQPVALTPENLSNAQWAGMQVDTQSLYYAQNRYYNPQIGRFISEDPLGLAGGFNPYAYCGGDPINFTDPMGLFRVYVGGSADYPFWEWDNTTLANGAGTGWAGFSTAVWSTPGLKQLNDRNGYYDAGSYKCQEGYGTSVKAGKVAMKALTAAGLKWAGNKIAQWLQDGCFVEGTLITLSDGTTKPIEQITDKDRVTSRNVATCATEGKAVKQTFKHTVHALTTAEFTLEGDASGKVVEAITGTTEHPFYVAGKGFVALSQLGVGNKIVTRAGPYLVVKSIKTEQKPEGVAVYNLEVADNHTYFVGTTNGGAWVHNDCNLVDSTAANHILNGDSTGGGHRFGTGVPGKTEFPANWSDTKILEMISDVATNPDRWYPDGGSPYLWHTFPMYGGDDANGNPVSWIALGWRENVPIKVVLKNFRIVTGFPNSDLGWPSN